MAAYTDPLIMSEKVVPKSVGVHDGPFHADEVTACALLWTYGLIDLDKIVRTRKTALLEQCEYVCDVGGVYDPARKLFDHHQLEYNGPLSSAGMVLCYLLDQGIIDAEEFHLLNDNLVIGVDAHDNGRVDHEPGVCTFSHIIGNLLPIEYDATDEAYMTAFRQAVDFAHDHLARMRKRHAYVMSSRQQVADAMAHSSEVLVFDEKLPWMDNFFALGGGNHSALFVIMPSGRHWKLRGIPPSLEDRMSVRVPLPEEWAGLLENDLKRVSGIPGAVFCHKGRFISIWRTKKDALAALNVTLARMQRANHL